MSAVVEKPWVRRGLAVVLVLALLAPVFAWASGAVGYSEPLENAAEQTGAADEAEPSPSLFSGYGIPGLGSGLGTLAAAVVGSALTLLAALAYARLLE
ncbi:MULTISPECIES: metal transporter [Salinibaculum]|uniref:metal transporter n=1 Tax=Salinibaculum TaxID=2732368 RepID=UPI0030CADC5C